MTNTKKIEAKELIDSGYLHEVNRIFFHPLGLALEIKIDNDTGNSSLSIQDHRDDMGGVIFDELDREKMKKFEEITSERFVNREWLFGFVIQGVPRHVPVGILGKSIVEQERNSEKC